MDMRPIGVFDSGLGGLTAVRSLWRILPEEDLIYFGDTARVPYGGRSRETILKYARQDVRFLRSFDLKAILIACGTVTTTSLSTLQSENDLPMVGVVEPTCRRAALVTKNKRVGMIATSASVRSGAYEATLRRLAPLAGKSGVDLRCDCAPGCLISAPEDDVYQIVFNLAENAVKYNVPGGSVDVSVRAEGGRVLLAVEDTGRGIPPEDLPNIFSRFYRVDKARSRERGGSGLGLSIVHDAVAALGGEIRVEPGEERGTRFTVSFPALDGKGAAE